MLRQWMTSVSSFEKTVAILLLRRITRYSLYDRLALVRLLTYVKKEKVNFLQQSYTISRKYTKIRHGQNSVLSR